MNKILFLGLITICSFLHASDAVIAEGIVSEPVLSAVAEPQERKKVKVPDAFKKIDLIKPFKQLAKKYCYILQIFFALLLGWFAFLQPYYESIKIAQEAYQKEQKEYNKYLDSLDKRPALLREFDDDEVQRDFNSRYYEEENDFTKLELMDEYGFFDYSSDDIDHKREEC